MSVDKGVSTTQEDVHHVERIDEDDNGILSKETAKAVIEQDTGFAAFTRWGAIKNFKWPVLLCVLSCLGCTNDGYQNQMPGSIISNAGFINQFGEVYNADGTVALAAGAVSIWGAMMPTGQIVGSLVSGTINDKVGRRAGMYTFTLCYIVGTIIEMVAKTPAQWAGAKVIFGFAQGITTATIPVYIGEIAPPQVRGTLLCLYGFFFAIGQLLASIVLYVLNNVRPLDYKVAIYTEWAFHGLWIFGGLIWLPESPWYYARKGENEKAARSLDKIYKGVPGYDREHEMRAILHEMDESNASIEAGWIELFHSTNLKRTMGASLAISSQLLVGTVVIFTYTTYFVQQAGIGLPFLASLIITILLLFGLVCSFFLTEIFGRRTLMIGGGCAILISNTVIGITGCLKKSNATNHAALAFVFLWVIAYGMSFAGVAWGLTSEGATPRLKPKTAAFSTMTYDLVSLTFTLSVPYMLADSGPSARDWGTKTLFLFSFCTLFSVIALYFYCPETKGRTQAEMDEMYETKIAPRKMSNYVSNLERAGGKHHRA